MFFHIRMSLISCCIAGLVKTAPQSVRTATRALMCAFLISAPLHSVSPAFAQEQAAQAQPAATRIEVDEQAGVIRFFIEGEKRAALDAAGLHVNGNIEFTGQTVDIGTWPEGRAADAP